MNKDNLEGTVVGIALLPVALGRCSRRFTGSFIIAGCVPTKEPFAPTSVAS